MTIEYENISARVTALKNDIYWLSIEWGTSGMYTSGFTARVSKKFPENGLWIQPPKYPPAWKSPFEFSGESPLWSLLEKLCREAVAGYQAQQESYGSGATSRDNVVTAEEFDRVMGVDEKHLDRAFVD